ncbi:aspartate/glutamate racemase family protein [Streptomyces purpureus]|nr:aspartate/glutamate racemase family protein [Streptomyces purpureus]
MNPNSSRPTTEMMAAIARRALGEAYEVHPVTVPDGPPMIVTEPALAAAVPHVVAAGLAARAEGACAAILVGAFGDPGVEELRAATDVPVAGLAESALTEAAAQGAHFGIATTTPGLAASIATGVDRLGLTDRYTGLRLTAGDPQLLAASPELMRERLALAVEACLVQDAADTVVIGGGPLGDAAWWLQTRFATPVVAPVPAACRRIARALSAPPPTPSG